MTDEEVAQLQEAHRAAEAEVGQLKLTVDRQLGGVSRQLLELVAEVDDIRRGLA